MKRGELLYSGKAKELYLTNNPLLCIQRFSNRATAFNGQKKSEIDNKGYYNNAISAFLLQYLEKQGVSTHFVGLLNETEMLVRRVEIIPIEVVVRNIAAGSLCTRLGLKEGAKMEQPVIEWYYKSDALGDPLINDDHIASLDLAKEWELKEMRKLALKVNDILVPLFRTLDLVLVDYKLECGRSGHGILIADEISPDTCRIWDASSGQKLDKDRFRQDLGDVEAAYREVYDRLAEMFGEGEKNAR
ncbi:MAG: phosphoribosylaminoimidazolesuccinocarboxamide synthase [Deltaproteobacteria bacterium]|nr:phosphoribosylaminoimidazolesuccinocarboxamide synthase [Deltaproteobacteria bacterium]